MSVILSSSALKLYIFLLFKKGSSLYVRFKKRKGLGFGGMI